MTVWCVFEWVGHGDELRAVCINKFTAEHIARELTEIDAVGTFFLEERELIE